MQVLILQNASAEGPGTIGDHLQAAGVPLTVIDLERGQPLPREDSCSHLILLGGPMAVYEMDRTPYLRDEVQLIERSLAAGRSILGVCLGAQLLAHALGSRVYPGATKEIGWSEVTLSDEGMVDRCAGELAVAGSRQAQVFQWHGDTFDLPPSAVLLASSAIYPHQAFRYGNNVYALQFHIEVTPRIVHGWLRNEQGMDLPLVDQRSQELYGPYRERAGAFYRAFFGC